MSVAKLSATLLLLLVSCCKLDAWGGRTHQGLTRVLLSSSTKLYEKIEISSLLKGSVAPDKRAKGWLPPGCHGYDPSKENTVNRRMGLAPKALQQIINRIRGQRMTKRQRAFEIGRALHLVQDLSQPFHVGSGLHENRYHARYEKWIDQRADYLTKSGRDLAASCDEPFGRPKEVAEELARQTRQDYIELHRLCRQREWGEELEQLTIRCFGRALRYSRYVESEVRRGKVKKSWAYLVELTATVIFVLTLHLLVRRSSASISQLGSGGIDVSRH